MNKMGLQYGEDDDDPKIFERTTFQANRKKTNFESDMDSLLFGGGPPPPRRKRGEQKKQAATTGANQSKGTLPINSAKGLPDKSITNSLLNKSKESQKSKVNDSFKKQAEKPKPKVDNYVDKKPVDDFAQQQSSIIIEQPKNNRQADTEEQIYNVGSIRFNRPAYIRKLKKVAEDFTFHIENPDYHVAHQVVRPVQCIKDAVKRLDCSGFLDKQFPPDSYSIGPKYRPELVIWKRPAEIYKSAVFGKYIEPNDIQPGTHSSAQFLSTLSCLAEREQNIKRLIQNQKINKNGFYYVRLNINGVWRYVSVDDHLPELDDKAMGAQSFHDSQAQIWPAIIEKAYAKAYQGYISFDQNVPREHYLRDLTGAPVKKYEVKSSNLSWAIGDALEKGWPVLAVPKQKIVDVGFNPNYSLSVLKCNSKGALQLRSSFGTISQRPIVSLTKQGAFQLSSTQTADYISHILIAQTDRSLKTTTIQAKHYGSFYSCFNFKVSETTYGTLSISQFDKRMFSTKSQYDYVPFRVILQMKNASEDGLSAYVNSAFSHHSRNLDLAVNLAPGSYYIYCMGQWLDRPYDYDVTIAAKSTVQIKRVYYQNFPNIIAQALTQENLSKGKRSAKGHVDEYILYHQPSNLVLITAKSLIQKPYTFTLNLSQVKFDTLTLLNAANPQDNFAKKNRGQLEQLKNSYFTKKTWDANLLGQQKYTWVFSTRLDYDPNNFKLWSFH